MAAVAPVTLLVVCTVSQVPCPTGAEIGTVRVVPRLLSPPNRPPAITTTAAAAAAKRHRFRRRLAAARSSTVPINSPGGWSSVTARTVSSARIRLISSGFTLARRAGRPARPASSSRQSRQVARWASTSARSAGSMAPSTYTPSDSLASVQSQVRVMALVLFLQRQLERLQCVIRPGFHGTCRYTQRGCGLGYRAPSVISLDDHPPVVWPQRGQGVRDGPGLERAVGVVVGRE